uniref:Vp1054 n=1 Tax=Lymantria dispar multicapsid nuclear polyhedrosis virus TaxID=10449 RepID=A0A2S1XBA2_NPVLD|nr:vp1054 [Lymantria dispar multiple nucleopolyhedrovirus]
MSSIRSVLSGNACVSERSFFFKTLSTPKTQCHYHPLRANCRAIKLSDDITDDVYYYHETTLGLLYLNYDRRPFYSCLMRTGPEPRGFHINATNLLAYVHLKKLDEDEEFFGIDEAGERQLGVVATVIKGVLEALAGCDHLYVLMIDELQVDLVYSALRAVVLPQRMVVVEQHETAPRLQAVSVFSVPLTTDSQNSQFIYRLFLVYNTVLTLMLKQRNPFNDLNKNISVIFRNLGRCPENKDRVKCCDLNYGGNAPGHIMCPPREMVKRVFHYAKWARSPNNYKRYFELLVKPPTPPRRFVENNTAKEVDRDLIVVDWYNFMEDFYRYFNIQQ